MSFDLTKIEGLDAATAAKIQEMHESDIGGLKNKNTELLGKLDSTKGLTTELEEARKKATEIEAAKLELEGKFKEANELREKETQKHLAELQAKNEALELKDKERVQAQMAGDYNLVESEVLRSVKPDLVPAAKALLQTMKDVKAGEDGKTVVSFNLNDKTYSDVNEFLGSAKEDATWKNLISANPSQGVGAEGSGGSGSKAAAGSNQEQQEQVKAKYNLDS